MPTTSDISGFWSGFYNYPGLREPTAFSADLTDDAGLLSGSISEHALGMDLTATIDGERAGRSVTFRKRYHVTGPHFRAVVHYGGQVDDDGNEISGRWTIPGHWDGTFIMVRGGSAVTEKISEDEEVPLETTH